MTPKALLPVVVLSVLCACGGTAKEPPMCVVVDAPATVEPNTVGLIVDTGPQCVGYINGLFASVTICVPGTTTCQIIDHMLVDTGSFGVRVLESVLHLALPAVTNASGQGLAECVQFVLGTTWGPVALADVTMGNELAQSLPIQLIGETAYTMPADCTGTPNMDVQTLGSNGVLGVGPRLQDCGASCASTSLSENPGLYYACSSAHACAMAAVPITQQVSNPVGAFPVDNNGTIIQLGAIGPSGATSVSGVLTFGIGTQTNNGLGSATVLAINQQDYFSTTFPVGGTPYTSVLDSGSNGLFFLNTTLTNLKICTSSGLSAWYCPASTTSLGATLSSLNSASTTIVFSVGDASKVSASAAAFDMAGPVPGFPNDTAGLGFFWGLPFFYGRTVYTAIEGKATPAGLGPYFAF